LKKNQFRLTFPWHFSVLNLVLQVILAHTLNKCSSNYINRPGMSLTQFPSSVGSGEIRTHDYESSSLSTRLDFRHTYKKLTTDKCVSTFRLITTALNVPTHCSQSQCSNTHCEYTLCVRPVVLNRGAVDPLGVAESSRGIDNWLLFTSKLQVGARPNCKKTRNDTASQIRLRNIVLQGQIIKAIVKVFVVSWKKSLLWNLFYFYKYVLQGQLL